MNQAQEDILNAIGKLTVTELSDLGVGISKKFGVSMDTPVQVQRVTKPQVEITAQQTEFDVYLQDIGPKKIDVIKLVREQTQLGLREAKALVDGAPSKLKSSVSQDEVNKLLNLFQNAGAILVIK